MEKSAKMTFGDRPVKLRNVKYRTTPEEHDEDARQVSLDQIQEYMAAVYGPPNVVRGGELNGVMRAGFEFKTEFAFCMAEVLSGSFAEATRQYGHLTTLNYRRVRRAIHHICSRAEVPEPQTDEELRVCLRDPSHPLSRRLSVDARRQITRHGAADVTNWFAVIATSFGFNWQRAVRYAMQAAVQNLNSDPTRSDECELLVCDRYQEAVEVVERGCLSGKLIVLSGS